MQRAALYIRVSTEEQAQHGYSLEAQKQALTEYAKKNDMAIVDYYVDDGYSARRKYTNRKEFMRMLADVQRNLIDIILFIKLDRWFRSVKDYYKIQEILEAHNVGWKTTEENYDTTTTNGRLYINIRLSVAQDESDRTSDRIKFVFDNKVTRGEVITGAQPIGFKIENKRLVHDEDTKEIAREIFQHYTTYQSRYETMRHIHAKYGLALEKTNLQRILRNTLYIGIYRGNENYCEPLIDAETFAKAQEIAASKSIRKPRSDRVYIFSQLIKCAECGHAMTINHREAAGKHYYYYRCDMAAMMKTCSNTLKINEKFIEDWLLQNIEREITERIAHYASKQSKHVQPSVDRAKIKRQMAKLKELFLNDLINLEEYRADYERFQSQLEQEQKTEKVSIDVEALSRFLKSNFKDIYDNLDRNKRQAFWRGIIKQIHIDSAKNLKIFFV